MSIPDELARREERLAKLAEARTKIEALTQIAEAMALIRSVLATAIEHDASETGQ